MNDETILAMMDARERADRDYVASLFGELTPREQALMREAAVTAFVAAVREFAPFGTEIPKDSEILRRALTICVHNEDLYPIFTQYEEEDESS